LFTKRNKILVFIGAFAMMFLILQIAANTEFTLTSSGVHTAHVALASPAYIEALIAEYIPAEAAAENTVSVFDYSAALFHGLTAPIATRTRNFGNQLEYLLSEIEVAAFNEESDHFECDKPRRVMYLTFDDGPTHTVTPIILDILAEREIHATFFVVGSMIRANPDVMQRIVDEGHTIGIHSYTHIYSQIYASLDAFIHDFTAIRDLIAEFTGYTPDIYRFPGGSNTGFNARVRTKAMNWLDENDYVFFDWNASIDDSIGGNRTPAQLLARGLETTRGDKVIMLAHDTQPATALMIADLIDILAQDFVFDVLTSDVEPVRFVHR